MRKLIYISILFLISLTSFSQDRDQGWKPVDHKLYLKDTVYFNKPMIMPSGDTMTFLLINDSVYVTVNGNNVNIQAGGSGILIGQVMDTLASLDSIVFTPQADLNELEGMFYYDTDKQSFVGFNSVTNTRFEFFYEQWMYVRNTTGSTITDATPVRIVGASGQRPLIAIASNSSRDSSGVIGLTTADVLHNGFTNVATAGELNGINTTAWSEGDTLYLGIAGGLTTIKPLRPYDAVLIGYVTYSNATQGKIQLAIQHGIENFQTTSIPFGNGDNELLTDSANFNYNNTTNTLRAKNIDADTVTVDYMSASVKIVTNELDANGLLNITNGPIAAQNSIISAQNIEGDTIIGNDDVKIRDTTMLDFVLEHSPVTPFSETKDSIENTIFSKLQADTLVIEGDTISQSQTVSSISFPQFYDSLLAAGVIENCFIMAISDSLTELTTANGDGFNMPYDCTIDSIFVRVNAPPTGSALTFDIKKNGTSIFSTPVTIDATEKTNVSAATPYVLSTTTLLRSDDMQSLVSSVGATFGGAGLKFYIYYRRN